MAAPLYDPLDPLGNAHARIREQQALQDQQQQDPLKVPMTPEEQDSILGRVGNATLSGMGYVGGLLDKYTGGRAVRGLLGGQPRELASILPFSDWTGITDESQAVSGKKLLQNVGALDPNDDSLMGTLGGMATEIALNPTTYMSLLGGATTAAGEAAAKIGLRAPTMAKALTGLDALTPGAAQAATKVGMRINPLMGPAAQGGVDVLNQPLHGLMSLHLPFMKPSSGLMIGAGQGGADVMNAIGTGAQAVSQATGASRVLDPLNKYVVQPATRYFRQAFDPSVGGASSETVQRAMPAIVAATDAGNEAIRGHISDLIRQAEAGGNLDRAAELRVALENTNNYLGPTASAAGGVQDLVDPINAAKQEMHANLAQTGGEMTMLNEIDPLTGKVINQSTRQKSVLPKSYDLEVQAGARQELAVNQARLGSRKEPLIDFPGGTTGINAASLDKDVSGVVKRLAPQGGNDLAIEKAFPGAQALKMKAAQAQAAQAALMAGQPAIPIFLTPAETQRLQDINNMAANLAKTRPEVTNLIERAQIIRERYGGFTDQMTNDAVAALPQQAALEARAAEAASSDALAAAANGKPPGTLTPAEQALVADAAAKALTPAEQESLALLKRYNQATEQAKYLGNLDPGYADRGIPLFNNHPIADLESQLKAGNSRYNFLEGMKDILAQAAVPADQAGANAEQLTPELLGLLGHSNTTTAMQRMMERLTENGKLMPGTAMTDLYIPADVMKDVSRFSKAHMMPEMLRPLMAGWDTITNITKAAQTTPWPGFNIRNLMSGQFMNFIKEMRDVRYGAWDPRSYYKPVVAAHQLITGQTIEGAADLAIFKGLGLTDEEATKRIADLAYQYRVLAPAGTGGAMADTMNAGSAAGDSLRAKIPGVDPFEGYWPTLKSAVPQNAEQAKPWALSGVGTYNQDVFAPIRASREISSSIDDTNRLSGFWSRLTQGYDAGAAATDVRAAHVDYEKLTPWERQVMRRVIPFYSYHRGILPAVLEELAQNPGGAAGQLAMQAHNLRVESPKEFIPEYLGGGLAMPLGQEEGGTQRFLTRLDTPIESAFDPIGHGLADTGMNILGQTNPLIKGPLEAITGKQFFSGRDIADLYPRTGSQPLDQLIMNSPLSRVLTTTSGALDPRKDLLTKAINFGTGVKLSDVDMEKQRDLAAREIISQSLRGEQGVGRFESYYARPGMDHANLSPEDVAMLRLQQALDLKAKARAAQQRNIGVFQPQ